MMASEEAMTVRTGAGDPAGWRRALRRELSVLLLLKLFALTLLWWLFFSPQHRVRVDARATQQHLGLAPADTTADAPRTTPP
jgi:hypothetical protein